MKNNEEVRINGLYAIRIGKNTVGIRIIRKKAEGGWMAISLKGGKAITIKDAKRLLGPWNPKEQDKPATKPPTSATVAKSTGKPSKNTTPSKATTRAKPDATKPKRTSGLDAAAKVLEELGQPLDCIEITKHMLEKGYWQTTGKTPAATIYVAIIREIANKGDDARFRKVDRGRFTLAD